MSGYPELKHKMPNHVSPGRGRWVWVMTYEKHLQQSVALEQFVTEKMKLPNTGLEQAADACFLLLDFNIIFLLLDWD